MSAQPLTVSPVSIGYEIERVLIGGDLSRLTPEQCVTYYNETCKSLNLNPLTRPFEYLVLKGKKTLYARKDCTEQLRTIHCVSVTIVSREVTEGVYVVTSRAALPNGRCDESIGAVSIDGLKGDDLANALMKTETKAKRRVTLSICGLGILDESELETVPSARVIEPVLMPVKPSPSTIEEQTIDEQFNHWSKILSACECMFDLNDFRTEFKGMERGAELHDRIKVAYAAALKRIKGQAKKSSPIPQECSICRGVHGPEVEHACE